MLPHGPHPVSHRVRGKATVEDEFVHALAEVLQCRLLLRGELEAARSVDLHGT